MVVGLLLYLCDPKIGKRKMYSTFSNQDPYPSFTALKTQFQSSSAFLLTSDFNDITLLSSFLTILLIPLVNFLNTWSCPYTFQSIIIPYLSKEDNMSKFLTMSYSHTILLTKSLIYQFFVMISCQIIFSSPSISL